jgi:DNA repair protein RecO (recombination protein O)
MKRVQHEPGYVLHSYDFSESSLVLEVFTRHHGRVALIAKGVKKPSSNFRAVLLPLQALSLAYSGDAEVRTLKGAEWLGQHVMPSGEALLSGLYINELVLRTLARDDPHATLYDAYHACVGALGTPLSTAALRAFELVLLREVGVLPSLSHESATLQPIEATRHYSLHPQGGLVSVDAAAQDAGDGIDGVHWVALDAALAQRDWAALTAACTSLTQALRPGLRALLSQHSGVAQWRTRQVMLEARGL